MENGVGVVEGNHRKNCSEGEEVFEEAIEPSLDENDDDGGLKVDSEVSVVGGVDGSGVVVVDDDDAKFYAAEGEVVENVAVGSDEGEEEMKVELVEEDRDTGSVVNEEGGDEAHVDEKIVDREVDSGEVVVEGKGKEVEDGIVEEIKSVVGDENVVEKFIVEEETENRDGEDLKGADAGAGQARDVEVVTANGNVDHVSEVTSGHDDGTVEMASEVDIEKFEESNEPVADIVHNDGGIVVEGALANTSLEHRESNGVAAEGASGDTDSENQDAHLESECNQTTLLPQNHDEGSKVEDQATEISAPVDGPAITSETERSTPLPTSSVSADTKSENSAAVALDAKDNASTGKGHGLTERCVTEDMKAEEERRNGQASRDTEVKPSQSSSSSSGKPANSTAPPVRPAGLGRTAPLLEPAPRAAQPPRANGQVSQVQSSLVQDATNGEVEEGDEIREKLQMIRVKFLRLAHRLGQTPHNVVVAQVLYRLGLAEQLRARNGGRGGTFSFDRASAMAEQLEATGREPLDFSCTIMVLGKTGVGKSATINSIFDDAKFSTDAFEMGTKKVQDVVGTVQGIKVRVIDTPGLLSSCSDQRLNERMLHSVKRFIKKSPPDIVLYLDRLDMPSRDFGDMPLLRTITEIFGPSIWFNAIVVLTHAASAPPEGPNGIAMTYDMFVTQRSHAVQQAIRQAAGDMRLMNPVSLVENHSACRTNRAGQRVLPNGQVWKPHLLLLSFASKILAEANTLLKLQDTPPGKPSTPRSRLVTLPMLLSSLLQSRPQLRLPHEQFGDDDAVDDVLDASSESDEESEYDELPPFRPLKKAQLAKLSKAQKKAYYDELEYREKLFMRKQLKEDRRRRKLMKKMEAAVKDMPMESRENVEEDSGGAASLPAPMPDLPLPASFDSDNPTHRYRYLDTSSQWLVRPLLDSHVWDHDVGYEVISAERMFAVKNKIPVSVSGQLSKDKKEANFQMEVASSMKHGEGKGTTLGFDLQTIGKDLSYTLRSETRFSNRRHNKATAGLSATLVGGALAGGMKFEDKLIISDQFRMVTSGGVMWGHDEIAYGGSLEATLRDKDYPVGRFLSTVGLSVMDWHGEVALGGNIQSQIPVGRSTNLVARANLNNKGNGSVSLRLQSSEQLQLALIGLLPLLRKLFGQEQFIGH